TAMSAEQIQLLISQVRHKKRDGSLYLMSERLAWCPEGRDHFDVSHLYSDIKCQKVSPEGKAKIQLQIILLNESSFVFHFSNTNTAEGKSDREKVKTLLAQMLPKFRRTIDKELEEKNKLLQQDSELFQTYKDLVVSGVISPEEFWNSHSSVRKLSSSKQNLIAQKVGVSAGFLAEVRPQSDGCNGLRYNLTSDTIHSIFSTYPAVKRKYLENVPDKLTEKDFWTMFFQSHYFHRDRTAQSSSKDLFADCVKKDEQDILSLLSLGVKDKFNDLTYLEDGDSAQDEGYGNTLNEPLPGTAKPSASQIAHKNIIKRFNHQNAMILSTSLRFFNFTNFVTQEKDGNGVTETDGEVVIKKARLKDATTYSDLESPHSSNEAMLNIQKNERYKHGPTLVCQAHQELNNDNVREGMRIISSQCENYKPRLSQVLKPSNAANALKELSSGMSSSSQTSENAIQHILSQTQQDELKQLYASLSELLRHFWTCFPANTTFLQEKVNRMCHSIETFQQTRLRVFQDQLRRSMVHANVTEHLDDMISAAFAKFNSWQSKKTRR
uniref:BSD domain-containing protein n=1 Tax=Ciona intestinalis TaxID=7719 RepID=F6RMT1_CIOIN